MTLALLFLAVLAQSPANLMGKPLPELELSRALQGRQWSQESLKGRVVILEIFQLGCPACMKHSLPHAKKLYAEFKRDPRVEVVAIATAFEKDEYPAMADESLIRAYLKKEGMRFPVMRDRDEKSVVKLGFGARYGTPTALVIDPEGIVRWHDWNSSEQASKTLKRTVDRLLSHYYVDLPLKISPELRDVERLLAKEQFGKAYAAIERQLIQPQSSALTAELRALKSTIESGAVRMQTRLHAMVQAGESSTAKKALKAAKKVLQGVPNARFTLKHSGTTARPPARNELI